MPELLPFLKSLISVPGLSGHEASVRKLIEEAWHPLADEVSVSRLGSLHALKRGNTPAPRPALLLAAHMDAIGLMVTAIEGDFLRLTEIGGVDARVLPGQPVIVHGRQELPGIVVQPPPRLLPQEYEKDPVPLKYLLVDTGLETEQLKELVRVGDGISFAQPPFELKGETLAGHTLDNRVSVAALTECWDSCKGAATFGTFGQSPPCKKKRRWAARSLQLSIYTRSWLLLLMSPTPKAPAARITRLTRWAKVPPSAGVPMFIPPCIKPSKNWLTDWKSPIAWKSCRVIRGQTLMVCRSPSRASRQWSLACRCVTCTRRWKWFRSKMCNAPAGYWQSLWWD